MLPKEARSEWLSSTTNPASTSEVDWTKNPTFWLAVSRWKTAKDCSARAW